MKPVVVTLVLPEKALAEAVAIVAVTELIESIVDCPAVEAVLRHLGRYCLNLVPGRSSRGTTPRTDELLEVRSKKKCS